MLINIDTTHRLSGGLYSYCIQKRSGKQWEAETDFSRFPEAFRELRQLLRCSPSPTFDVVAYEDVRKKANEQLLAVYSIAQVTTPRWPVALNSSYQIARDEFSFIIQQKYGNAWFGLFHFKELSAAIVAAQDLLVRMDRAVTGLESFKFAYAKTHDTILTALRTQPCQPNTSAPVQLSEAA